MTTAEIARLVSGKVRGDEGREICGVAALQNAGSGDLAYAEGARAVTQVADSKAGCVLVPEGAFIEGRTTIVVPRPKLAFIRAAEALVKPELPLPGIDPTAMVDPEAEVAADACVGPHVVIERGARVGAETRLGTAVSVGAGVEIGTCCVLYPHVTIYPGARIGNRVILHAGVVVGSDGFGYVFADGRHHKFPQIGGVIIEDDVEIGANSTIDRGSLGTTVIGQGTKIDNLVQVAHNVKIGRHCVIAAQTGISGSVQIGDYVVMGGQVGIGDHARIEDEAVLGGGAGVLPGKIVRSGETVWGRPARPLDEFKRMYAHWSNLPKLAERVKALMREAGKREE